MTYTEFIKEIENNIAKANCNKLNIGEYEEKQKQIYKQIRADAIDEFVTIIKERVGMDWEWDFYFIGQIAEELKEKEK